MARLPETGRPKVMREYKADEDLTRIFLKPNRSLTWRQSVYVFVGMASFLVILGLVFALMGYWLILPFAGLEVMVLGICLHQVAVEGRKRQLLLITPDRVRVEKGLVRRDADSRGGSVERVEFVRAWTRVRLRRSWQSWHPSRLTVGASGEEVEIGEFLTEQEKDTLAEELDAAITGATTGEQGRSA